MQIDRMIKEDAPYLAELDIKCFSVPWSEKSFREECDNPHATYFVAKADGKIVGYGGVWIVADEAQITNIAVHPDYRKQKIASAILEEILSLSEDAERIILEVRESNVPAIGLYEKYGFKKAGIRKNFYHSPVENGITMVRGEF